MNMNMNERSTALRILSAETLRLHGLWLRQEPGGARADLSSANLSDADLRRAVLSGADLRRAVLSGAVLSGADLSGAVLSDADLSDADLSDAVLSGADLSGADLSGAVLSGADLSGAVLSGAVLRGADLSDAVLRRAVLSGAVLSGANLSGADLSGANLSGADLSGADLSGAVGIATEEEENATLARIRDAVAADPARLEMVSWHGPGWNPEEPGACGTTHCLAGWAQALSDNPTVRQMDPSAAGAMLLPRHSHLFAASSAEVLAVLGIRQ